jgi:hypothetical protein
VYKIIKVKLFRFRPGHLKKVQRRNCLHTYWQIKKFCWSFWRWEKTEITNLKLCHLCKRNFLNCFSQLWCMNKYVPFRQNHESTVVGPRWTWGHFPNWLFNSRAKKVRNEKKHELCAVKTPRWEFRKICQKNCRKKAKRIKLTWSTKLNRSLCLHMIKHYWLCLKYQFLSQIQYYQEITKVLFGNLK